MGWANLPRDERLAKNVRCISRTETKERQSMGIRTTRRQRLTCSVHTRMNECFKSRLPSMKDRDITAEGLLGCTYDEYDRYRYLCKWPIWRV